MLHYFLVNAKAGIHTGLRFVTLFFSANRKIPHNEKGGNLMNISLNAGIVCTDKPCGKLNHIILRSTNDEITHLVVRTDNSDTDQYLVPLSMIVKADRDQVWLNCTSGELQSLPRFEREVYLPRSVFEYQLKPYLVTTHAVLPGAYIPIEVEKIPIGELAIKKGASVEATDGQIGFIDEILLDPEDHCISHLVLRKGHLWDQEDVTIPIDFIDRIEEDVVHLNIRKKEVEDLPAAPIHRLWVRK